MKEKLKKLIEGLLFLNTGQRKKLLAKLDDFSETELQRMEIAFSSLYGKENDFLKKFFEKNPDIEKQAQALVEAIEASAMHGEAAEDAIKKLGEFSKNLNDKNI